MINNRIILDKKTTSFTVKLSESFKTEFINHCGDDTPSAVLRLLMIDYTYDRTQRQKNKKMRELLGSCVSAYEMQNGALMEEVVKKMVEALKSV